MHEKIKPVRKQALISPPSPCVANPGTCYAICETGWIVVDFFFNLITVGHNPIPASRSLIITVKGLVRNHEPARQI